MLHQLLPSETRLMRNQNTPSVRIQTLNCCQTLFSALKHYQECHSHFYFLSSWTDRPTANQDPNLHQSAIVNAVEQIRSSRCSSAYIVCQVIKYEVIFFDERGWSIFLISGKEPAPKGLRGGPPSNFPRKASPQRTSWRSPIQFSPKSSQVLRGCQLACV